ncbi:TFIIH basal transcription factor complex helicase XPD subunit, putative [Plasmodium malariae]|uniref:DNA 5'-3' helicase n=1 Tax=Plasmodium malariae TaxID=5858 RepID=A0A1C3KC69_PLAMA|nr:TFIIH basal transcription factor complex helicase XPD subunit, putative [Plasmodium malariae]
MVVFYLDDLEVFFPYDYIYPEQYAYMKYLKKTLDSEGHCVLEMPTGTGKTVAIFSLITSYQYYKNDEGKFIFCTRTVAEMEKSLIELKKVIMYRINIIKKRNEKKCNADGVQERKLNSSECAKESNCILYTNQPDDMPSTDQPDGMTHTQQQGEVKSLNNNLATNEKFGKNSEILAIGISARRCMCVNEKVLLKHEREKIDEECRKLTATFVREKKYINRRIDQVGQADQVYLTDMEDMAAQVDRTDSTNRGGGASADRLSEFILKNKHNIDIEDYFDIYNSKNSIEEYDNMGLCGYFENFKKEFVYELIEPGVYTIEDLKILCKNYKNSENVNVPICPYFCAKKIIEISKVIVLNYQYVIDPKVSKSIFLGKDMSNRVNFHKNDIIVFDEAHNIDSVCLEALSVNIDRNILNKASINIKRLLKKIENSKSLNEKKLKEECNKILQKIKSQKLCRSSSTPQGEGPLEEARTHIETHLSVAPCPNGDEPIHMLELEKKLSGETSNELVQGMAQDVGDKKEGTVPVLNEKNNLTVGLVRFDDREHSLEGNREGAAKKRKVEGGDVYFDDDMNLVFSGMLGDKNCTTGEDKTGYDNAKGDQVQHIGRSTDNSSNSKEALIDDLRRVLSQSGHSEQSKQQPQHPSNTPLNHGKRDSDDLWVEGNLFKEGAVQGNFDGKAEEDLADLHYSPLLVEDIVKNIVIPGNIRKSEHFLNLMRIIVVYLKKYINIYEITSEGPLSFLYKCEKDTKLDTSFFKYCFDRLKSLLNALQIVNIDDYSSLNVVCNFCTLLGNYVKGFVIICEPYPEATGIYDPVIQFACLDSSIAMKSVINKYKSIVLTSGTISPLELYPKLLNFKTVLTASFPISFDRNCVCPLIVTKSSDLVPLSSQYTLRNDMNVIKNYGMLLVEMCKNIPDGIVAYFPSYIYMEQVISSWYELGVISNILEYKLIYIETKDIVSTTIALHNFKRACDLGKGAIFLSICRGKIAEGIDFDKHYGKCVILFGIPYQYTLSKILKSRLDFLKETYNIQENEFLTFDAMRQASQCVGRIIRNKKDYGIMIFSDIRYARNDKKSKLPPWIIKCMDISNVNLTVGTAVNISKKFLLNMSKEYKETGQTKISQELLQNQRKCWSMVKSVLNMDDFI